MGNQRVGRINYCFCTAVVLFQTVLHGLRIIFFEAQYILYSCSAERVYTLRIISHHCNIAMVLGQFFHNEILCKIGILILIHQNELEAAAYPLQSIWKVSEKYIGVEKDIIKIHCSGQFAFLGIKGIDLMNTRLFGCRIILYGSCIARIGLRCYEIVLGH